jgi:hypothetical protein
MEFEKITGPAIERIKELYKKFPELFIFFFVSIGVLLAILNITNGNSGDVAEISKHYNDADKKMSERINSSARLDSINLCENLKTVHACIGDLKQSKLYLATKYQRFFIICFTIGIFFIVSTAVITFVITKRGWDNSTRQRKALLLTSAFYGILLTTYPKLFDQDQNYKTNFTDYTELSKAQMFVFKRLCPYLDKKEALDGRDSTNLINAMDTATTVLMQHANIDISLDKKQLEIKSIDLAH